MTLIFGVEGIINVDAAFCLLPITRLVMPPTKRKSKKCKIPLCGIPGAILSMRYRGATRGIIRSSSTRHFKNSVTLDIATQTKNLSIKLSSCGFHISGATSVEQGKEAVQYIINYVTGFQEILTQMNEDPELKEETFTWFRTLIQGSPVILSTVNGPRLLHRLNRPDESSLRLAPHAEMAALLLRQSQEYEYYEDFQAELEGIASLHTIASPSLRIRSVRRAMVNYNYDLGFGINRPAFALLFDGLEGFSARYDNAVEHSVTIEIPYDPVELARLRELASDPLTDEQRALSTINAATNRRKDKAPRHTFIIYESGLVTQSGPDEGLMREPYEMFTRLAIGNKASVYKDVKKRKNKAGTTKSIVVEILDPQP